MFFFLIVFVKKYLLILFIFRILENSIEKIIIFEHQTTAAKIQYLDS